jgi:hypothetical protein
MYELSKLGGDLPAKPHVKGHFSEMSIFYYNRPGNSRRLAADSGQQEYPEKLSAACCMMQAELAGQIELEGELQELLQAHTFGGLSHGTSGFLGFGKGDDITD